MTEATASRTLEETTTPDTIDRIHALLSELFSECSVSASDAVQFELAVAEIGANIIEHAGAGNAVHLRLELEVTPEHIAARYSDDGSPARVDLDTVSLPDDFAERGRGLAIAVNVLDELAYRRSAGVNHWRLVRERSS